jgi:hypothetical protein
MEDDILEWDAATTDATGAGALMPSHGQIIELYRDSTRLFRGHAIRSKLGMSNITVEVKGPWWWMEQLMIESSQTDQTGVTKTRPSYVFPTQNVRTSLITLVNLMIASGVPIQLGTIDTMYSFPRITLAETSYAQAITELMSTHPDAVLWFDYSGTGYPKLMISRRPSMTGYDMEVGNPDHSICDIQLWPRIELEVKRVDLISTSRRASDKFLKFESSGSGSATISKNQTIVVSGEAVNNAFLPKDQFESFQIKTYPTPPPNSGINTVVRDGVHEPIGGTNGELASFIYANDPQLATIKRDFGILPIIAGAACEISTLAVLGIHRQKGSQSYILGGPSVTSKSVTTGMHVILSEDRIPEWVYKEHGYTLITGTLKASVYYFASLPSADTWNPAFPSWWTALSQRGEPFEGFPGGQVNNANSGICGVIMEVSIPVTLISASFPVLTRIYRKSDYDYISPPAGMAEGLLAAQDWVPWEGSIQRVSDEPSGESFLGRKFNVMNAFPECATMNALAKSIVYDFSQGRRTINIGPPRRLDFRGLASKFRRAPTDNITYL